MPPPAPAGVIVLHPPPVLSSRWGPTTRATTPLPTKLGAAIPTAAKGLPFSGNITDIAGSTLQVRPPSSETSTKTRPSAVVIGRIPRLVLRNDGTAMYLDWALWEVGTGTVCSDQDRPPSCVMYRCWLIWSFHPTYHPVWVLTKCSDVFWKKG